MAKKIEILENTLLKLLVRRGTNQDRKAITLSEGELGYTTDTNRLYVGDGSTEGGVLVGNKFLGQDNEVTTFTEANIGDLAYDSNDRALYAYMGPGTPSAIENWQLISSVTDEGTGNILIGQGQIKTDLAGDGLVVTGGQLAVDCNGIKTNKVESCTGVMQLPNQIQFGAGGSSYQYTLPARNNSAGKFLVGDNNGNLSWSNDVASDVITYFNSNDVPVPVGTIAPFASLDAVMNNWLICDGSSKSTTAYPDLFDVIGYNYGGSGGTFNVPNLINKTIYGTAADPSGELEYGLGGEVTEAAQDSIAIARARFSGSVSGLSQEGFSSVVRNSAGVYTLTFATPRASNSYSVIATREAGHPLEGDVVVRNRTTTSFVLHSSNDNSSPGDPDGLHVVVFEKASNSGGGGGIDNSLPIDAKAMVYAIKAVGDPIVNSSLTVRSPLTATLGGIQQGENPFNPLSGDIEVGLGNNISVNSVTTNDITVNNEITFSDSTTLSTAPVSTGLGIGQSYEAVSVAAGSPGLKNTSDRSWFVHISLLDGEHLQLRNSDSDPWLELWSGSSDRGPASIILQPGASVNTDTNRTMYVLR